MMESIGSIMVKIYNESGLKSLTYASRSNNKRISQYRYHDNRVYLPVIHKSANQYIRRCDYVRITSATGSNDIPRASFRLLLIVCSFYESGRKEFHHPTRTALINFIDHVFKRD
jgi:hypothetical protein